MLNDIKLLLGITSTDKDDLLSLLISQCGDEAKLRTGRHIVEGMEAAISQMVVFRYNRLGTEGLDSESYSGANYSYSGEYPESILKMLDELGRESGTRGKLITY